MSKVHNTYIHLRFLKSSDCICSSLFYSWFLPPPPLISQNLFFFCQSSSLPPPHPQPLSLLFIHWKNQLWYFLQTVSVFKHYLLFGASPVSQMVKNLTTMQETQVWSPYWEDPLEKGMATHSSILAWRIPWTEESSGLQSMGSQRVRHNWVTKHTHSVRNWSSFMLLHVGIQFSQYNLLKTLSFLHCVFLLTQCTYTVHCVLPLCTLTSYHVSVGLLLGSFLFHWSVSGFAPAPYCFDYFHFIE